MTIRESKVRTTEKDRVSNVPGRASQCHRETQLSLWIYCFIAASVLYLPLNLGIESGFFTISMKFLWCSNSNLAARGGEEAQFFKMPLDHFGNESRTFLNRYWFNDTYYRNGGPVFLFDAGEQNAEPLVSYYLQEYHGLSAIMRLAKKYHGLAVLWEHRFYGESLPFPVDEYTTIDQWQFLSSEQALEDVVYFARNFPLADRDSKLLPSKTPWIWLGASYPGIRGAVLRLRNPETFYATWASSAPVQAQIDMASYYHAVQRSMTRNCSADWATVTKYVDGVLSSNNNNQISQMKFELFQAKLSGPGGDTTNSSSLDRYTSDMLTNADTAEILMDPLHAFQYYGFEASVLPFCDILETSNFTKPATDDGVAATTRSIEEVYRAFLLALSETAPRRISSQGAETAWLAWTWQYCSEYGYFQRADPDYPLNIATSFLSIEYFQKSCIDLFGERLPRPPRVENILKYGGWDMQPSNTMFTNGEFDPWKTMSVMSDEPNSPHRSITRRIPFCNKTPAGTDVFGIVHSSMVHVPDMRVLLVPDSNHSGFQTVGYHSPISPQPFYESLELFQRALDEWLPCFVPQ